MTNIIFVSKLNTENYLSKNYFDVIFARLILFNKRKKITFLGIFHHNIIKVFSFYNFKNLDNIRMIKVLTHSYFNIIF